MLDGLPVDDALSTWPTRTARSRMSRPISRALAAAVVGGLAGWLCLVVAFVRHPDLTLEMDRDLPRLTSGFYPVEHQSDTYAWTASRAALRLPGLDRRSPWLCSVRFRGARPAQLPQPQVEISADGIVVARQEATNDYREVEVTLASRPNQSGVTISIASSPTFVPGASDNRELGVQVDRLVCRPEQWRLPLPPLRAIRAASFSAAVFGAVAGLIGPGLLSAVGGTILLARRTGATARDRTRSIQPLPGQRRLDGYLDRGTVLLIVMGMERWQRTALHPAARFVPAVFGRDSIPEAARTAPSVQAGRRCSVSRPQVRVGAGGQVLFHISPCQTAFSFHMRSRCTCSPPPGLGSHATTSSYSGSSFARHRRSPAHCSTLW